MRLIKFRAWDKLSKQWVYLTIEHGRVTCFDKIIGIDLSGWMEFTGLTDKNGKEIYEGDIIVLMEGHVVSDLEGNFAKHDSTVYAEVKYHVDKARFLPLTLPYGKNTVVGNIYENPELLKQ